MITAKVAFVLRLVDDFSGKTILKKKFLFRRGEQLVKPIEKEEGLYVFLEPMDDMVELEITGVDFHPCRIMIEKGKLKSRDMVMNVRLYGRPGGNFPYRYSLLEGRLEQGKVDFPVKVCAKMKKNTGISFKEIRTVDNEMHLFVNGFTKEQMKGNVFALSDKKKTEVFVITDKVGMNEYIIEGQLMGKYSDKQPIERVYRSVTDRDGKYAIPVGEGEQEQGAEIVILTE